MVLENEKCFVEIKVDGTYTIDSVDNRHYDVALNPCQYKRSDLSTTFSIHVDLFEREYYIALIGPFYAYDLDCAILDDETLSVLQDDAITQIRITDGTMIRHIKLDSNLNFGIYKVEKGYIIYGETEITMLDFNFAKRWSFLGKDIFVSLTNKQPFAIKGNTICLYDFEDNYYEIDFEGKQIN